MKALLIILLALLLAERALCAYCNGKPKDYFVNNEPIWAGNSQLLKRHQYGELHQIGTGTTQMKLIHVYGSMYQMGLAQGVLLREDLQAFMGELWGYIEQQIEDGIPKKIPKFLKKGVANFAIGTVLDLNYEITLPYTNKKYY